jgi:hypothetical protein
MKDESMHYFNGEPSRNARTACGLEEAYVRFATDNEEDVTCTKCKEVLAERNYDAAEERKYRDL